MTDFSDVKAFKEHPLWESVAGCLESWTDAKGHTATDRHTIDRVLTVVRYLAAYKPIPATLFPSDRLSVANNLQRYVDEMTEVWNQWDETTSIPGPNITELDRWCDLIMTSISAAAWPSLQKESRARIFDEAAQSYQAAAEASLTFFEGNVSQNTLRLEALDVAVKEASSTATAFEAKADSLLDDWEAEREGEMKEARTKLSQLIASSGDLMKTTISEHRDQMAELFRSSDEQVQHVISELKGYATQGEKLLQIVGDQSQAGGYLKFANAERRGYRLWALAGSLAIIVTAVYLGVEFTALAEGEDPSTAVIVFKAALSITGLSFSALAFREAGKKQRQSLEARYRALDLLALRPYAEGLDADDAKALRTMLGERLFKSTPEDAGRKTDEKITTLRLDLGDVKTAVDTAKTVKDIAGGSA